VLFKRFVGVTCAGLLAACALGISAAAASAATPTLNGAGSTLVAPIEADRADFTGGPTRPRRPPQGSIEQYVDLLERSIYEDLVGRSVSYLPLQNTAWRTATLRGLHFDPTIPGAEDYDLEIRAVHAGHRGKYVPEAWVYHDKSDETNLLSWMSRRYRLYHVPMAMALIKNGELRGRLAERRRPVRHPLRYLDAAMKPPALVSAALREHRRRSRRSGGTTPS